jgi:hypothetical protein
MYTPKFGRKASAEFEEMITEFKKMQSWLRALLLDAR